MNNLTRTMIHQMSRRTGVALTSKHWEILEFANEYYYRHHIGPLYQVLMRKLGVSRSELESLFPNGLTSIYTWVGIPVHSPEHPCKPTAMVKVRYKREVYLDYNGTTGLRPEVQKVLQDYAIGKFGFGNASSSTKLGKEAYERLFKARRILAKTLNVQPTEIIFTASGSEANNMAIKGMAFKHWERKGHLITTAIEHPSVISPFKWLESMGFEVSFVQPNPQGIVTAKAISAQLREDTRFVSIMTVNNEIGTINPIDEIGAMLTMHKIPLMVDAAQGYGKLRLNPKKSGIALLSLTGHKIYAPKGIGVLYKDEALDLPPLIHGGGQEFGLRAGTENLGMITALSLAAKLAHQEMDSEQHRLEKLRDYFLSRLKELDHPYIINGSLEARLPNNLNLGFEGIDSGALLLSLNHIGVYVSSGSACHSGSRESSHVIRALGVDTERYGTIRFSFGLNTNTEDLDYLFEYLPEILKQLSQSEDA